LALALETILCVTIAHELGHWMTSLVSQSHSYLVIHFATKPEDTGRVGATGLIRGAEADVGSVMTEVEEAAQVA
jgi:hypothetical protein